MRIWKQRKEQVPALPFIVSMSPPGYPSHGYVPALPTFVSSGKIIAAPWTLGGQKIGSHQRGDAYGCELIWLFRLVRVQLEHSPTLPIALFPDHCH